MLNCSDVKKTYFNKTAVENISLSLENGKIYALLGPERERKDDVYEDDCRTCKADKRNDSL